MKITSFLSILLLIVAVASTTAQAAVLITSQFSGTLSPDGTQKAVTWSGLEKDNASSNLIAIFPTGGSGFAHPGGAYGSDNQVFVNTNLNVEPRSDRRGFLFSLIPSANYDLASLQVETAHSTNTGTVQTFSSDLTLDIREGGNSIFSETKSNIAYNGPFLTQDFDLTGISVVASTSYLFEVTVNNLVGDGAYFSSDSLTLSSVPEPSSFVFLAGLLAVGFVFFRRQ